MILIVCVDEKNGMLFNNRRQSKDKVLIQHIVEKTKDNKLWINNYSDEIFDNYKNSNIIVDDDFIKKIDTNEYCFVEDIQPDVFEDKIDKIILYNWNREYPADRYFNISLKDWIVESEIEFSGSSHEKITEKIYIRGIK